MRATGLPERRHGGEPVVIGPTAMLCLLAAWLAPWSAGGATPGDLAAADEVRREIVLSGGEHRAWVIETPTSRGFWWGEDGECPLQPHAEAPPAVTMPGEEGVRLPPPTVSRRGSGSFSWKHRGPEGMSALALMPAPWDPTTLYAISDGVHRLELQDGGGALWFSTGLTGADIERIGLDPWHPGTLYASQDGGGLLKSIDGGDTWTGVGFGLPAPSRIRRIVFHPTNPSVVYVLDGARAVYVSENEGASWTPRNEGLPPPFLSDDYSDLVIDPVTPSTMYASSSLAGVYKTIDAGASWTEANNGLPSLTPFEGFVHSLAIDPFTPTKLYAGVGAGAPGGSAYRTIDGGDTWFRMSGVPRQNGWTIAVDPTNPNVVYVGLLQNAFDPGESGVWKSTDAGLTWAPTELCSGAIQLVALDGSVSPASVYAAEGADAGVLRSVDEGASFDELISGTLATRMFAVTIAPSDPSIAYAGSFARLVKTTDGGITWSKTGFCDTWTSSIVVHPTDPGTAYAAVAHRDVYRTTDGGETWVDADLGITSTSVYRLAMDPDVPTTLYAAAREDLYKSTDAGASWFTSSEGMEAFFILDVAVAPSSSATLYAGTVNGGVFKSVTGGLVWFPANAGLPLPTELSDVYTEALAVDPTNPDIVYARSSDQGTFKTTTGGSAWLLVDDTPYARQIVIDPVNPQRVFAVGWFGVRVSTNGGGGWLPMNAGLESTVLEGMAVGSDGTTLLAATALSMARWEAEVVGVDPPAGVPVPGRARFTALAPSPLTSGGVTLRFELGHRARVGFEILDASSRLIASVDARTYAAGAGAARWDGRIATLGRGSEGSGRGKAPSGVYLVRMLVDGRAAEARKLVVAR